MIRLLLFVVATVVPAIAWAADYPALHKVQNVGANDRLNVRSVPGASGAIVGSLSADAKNVEVIRSSKDGRWGQVNVGEQSGWVALRFLNRTSGPLQQLPTPLKCFGTEPFWSLDLKGDGQVEFESGMGADTKAQKITKTTRSANRLDRYGFVTQNMVATVSVAVCDDGMSDRNFGMSIELITRPGEGAAQLSGCCTLSQ